MSDVCDIDGSHNSSGTCLCNTGSGRSESRRWLLSVSLTVWVHTACTAADNGLLFVDTKLQPGFVRSDAHDIRTRATWRPRVSRRGVPAGGTHGLSRRPSDRRRGG